jgi:hypothetical protein
MDDLLELIPSGHFEHLRLHQQLHSVVLYHR